MKTEDYYNKKVKPFMFDDTIKYKDLTLLRKIWLWFLSVNVKDEAL